MQYNTIQYNTILIQYDVISKKVSYDIVWSTVLSYSLIDNVTKSIEMLLKHVIKYNMIYIPLQIRGTRRGIDILS